MSHGKSLDMALEPTPERAAHCRVPFLVFARFGGAELRQLGA
jgi:hypothetical protein